jgi:hypothetical protein
VLFLADKGHMSFQKRIGRPLMVTTFAKTIWTATMLLSLLILSGCSNDDDGQSPQVDQFEKFEYRFAAGPAPPGADSSGFIELASDGTLRNDKSGEVPSTVHTAMVTQADLDAVIPVLINARLVSLLDLPGAICTPPTDIFEMMTLTMAGESHSHEMTWCSEQPIEDARNVLRDLASRYFP